MSRSLTVMNNEVYCSTSTQYRTYLQCLKADEERHAKRNDKLYQKAFAEVAQIARDNIGKVTEQPTSWLLQFPQTQRHPWILPCSALACHLLVNASKWGRVRARSSSEGDPSPSTHQKRSKRRRQTLGSLPRYSTIRPSHFSASKSQKRMALVRDHLPSAPPSSHFSWSAPFFAFLSLAIAIAVCPEPARLHTDDHGLRFLAAADSHVWLTNPASSPSLESETLSQCPGT